MTRQEIDAKLQLLRKMRDRDINAIRVIYAQKITALVAERNGVPKLSRIEQAEESPDTIPRKCRSCGHLLLIARAENVLLAKKRCDRAMGWEVGRLNMHHWLKKLRSLEFCCYWCQRSSGKDHSNLCWRRGRVQAVSKQCEEVVLNV